MSNELKPCPFCGGDNLGLNHTGERPEEATLWWVDCYECSESSHPRGSSKAAIAAWNRRAPVPPSAT